MIPSANGVQVQFFQFICTWWSIYEDDLSHFGDKEKEKLGFKVQKFESTVIRDLVCTADHLNICCERPTGGDKEEYRNGH